MGSRILSYQEKKASGTARADLCLVPGLRVPDPRGLYESWSLRSRVLLSVPVAVLGGVSRPLPAQFRPGDLRPDRVGDADWARRAQERHPDRGVCSRRDEEGAAPGRGGTRGGSAAAPPDSHDVVRVHLRMVPLWVATGAGAIARQILAPWSSRAWLAATAIAIFIIPRALRAGGAAGESPRARAAGARSTEPSHPLKTGAGSPRGRPESRCRPVHRTSVYY